MGTRNRREPGKAFLRGNRIQLGMPTFSLFNLIFTYPFRKFFVTERWVLNPGREKNSVGVFFFFKPMVTKKYIQKHGILPGSRLRFPWL